MPHVLMRSPSSLTYFTPRNSPTDSKYLFSLSFSLVPFNVYFYCYVNPNAKSAVIRSLLKKKYIYIYVQEMKANVTVNCVHPGIVRTRLTRDREGIITDLVFFLASKLLKTIPQAAATTCYVATHPRLENVSGKYFADCNETLPSKSASNSYQAQRLWTFSEIMVGLGGNPKSVFQL
ncbi:hypothetical protein Cgig2_000844 [Carnegiea gigantea]|uniref:Uncharacterized protein n=1 Tax=Carnegiea gigantea TaxID=171969 RepID=A0A9Q1JLV0_9CARY|nr:hypothetical protein Cgig2_000844 [Carnegiea gigantea]